MMRAALQREFGKTPAEFTSRRPLAEVAERIGATPRFPLPGVYRLFARCTVRISGCAVHYRLLGLVFEGELRTTAGETTLAGHFRKSHLATGLRALLFAALLAALALGVVPGLVAALASRPRQFERALFFVGLGAAIAAYPILMLRSGPRERAFVQPLLQGVIEKAL